MSLWVVVLVANGKHFGLLLSFFFDVREIHLFIKGDICISIRTVFATNVLVTAIFSELFNWGTGVDTDYKPLHKEVTIWCAKP